MALLIGGHRGSGKSVLLKILNTHPEIVITDDFRNFLKIDVSYWRHVGGLKMLVRRKKLNYYPLGGAYITFRYLIMIWVRSLRNDGNGRVSASDVDVVLKRVFPRASIVGDTCPRYALILDRTVSIPCLKCVIVYRDCRDVAAEMQRRLLRGEWRALLHNPKDARWIQNIQTAEKVAHNWLKYVQFMERYRDSVYMIRYEDLVADPQAVLTQFGRWLGVDPQHFQYDLINPNFFGEYKQVLSEQDVNDILAVAGPSMERLGYL